MVAFHSSNNKRTCMYISHNWGIIRTLQACFGIFFLLMMPSLLCQIYMLFLLVLFVWNSHHHIPPNSQIQLDGSLWEWRLWFNFWCIRLVINNPPPNRIIPESCYQSYAFLATSEPSFGNIEIRWASQKSREVNSIYSYIKEDVLLVIGAYTIRFRLSA